MLRWIRNGFFALVGLLTFLAVVSAASNLGLPERSASTEILSPVQKARLAEAFHLREALGEEIWPGWNRDSIPQILYNEGFAFLVGMAEPSPGWYVEPGHERRGNPWEPVAGDAFLETRYFRQALSLQGPTPQAFAVRVGDVWVGSLPTQEWARLELGREIRSQLPGFLKWIPPYRILSRLFFRGGEHQISLILHESFHAYQGRAAPGRFSAAERMVSREGIYPWDDPGMTETWRRELDLLAEGLLAETPSQARSLAREFLNVRRVRREGLSPEMVAFENGREWLEGLAKYVEVKSGTVARSALSQGYQPHSATTADGEFNGYEDAEEAFHRDVAQLRRMASQGTARFYYSGMALAFLLDRLGSPTWKEEVMDSDLSLDRLLAEAVSG